MLINVNTLHHRFCYFFLNFPNGRSAAVPRFVKKKSVNSLLLRSCSAPPPLLLRIQKICTFADTGNMPSRYHTLLTNFSNIMAKGNRTYVMSGKLGNEVLTKVSNSNNKEKQGSRVYRAEITNPKTLEQAKQRLKMQTLVGIYRALSEDVLDHSFQGVKYGGRSHSRFMQLNLKKPYTDFPYIVKGQTKFVPAPVILSTGGMPKVTATPGRTDGVIPVSLNTNITATGSTLYSAWLELFLAANPQLKLGDQVTVVFVFQRPGANIPIVRRIVLDASKYAADATVAKVFEQTGIDFQANGISVSVNYKIIAAAIILSRPVVSKTSGSVSWLRNNAQLAVDSAWMAANQSEEMWEECIASYLPADATIDSDWYLNQGTTA